ncbi:uncharacterized protein LOC125944445 [Dermacentor silvarum]|uniref:uncharacterized protein LOC125944445 n=1 Tax=Dermacentor silvarum TaxID=543639 RepID=UPI002101B1A8|nr:uncharacterized protein LOC125944445 [Dermacentor silvarum]
MRPQRRQRGGRSTCGCTRCSTSPTSTQCGSWEVANVSTAGPRGGRGIRTATTGARERMAAASCLSVTPGGMPYTTPTVPCEPWGSRTCTGTPHSVFRASSLAVASMALVSTASRLRRRLRRTLVMPSGVTACSSLDTLSASSVLTCVTPSLGEMMATLPTAFPCSSSVDAASACRMTDSFRALFFSLRDPLLGMSVAYSLHGCVARSCVGNVRSTESHSEAEQWMALTLLMHRKRRAW